MVSSSSGRSTPSALSSGRPVAAHLSSRSSMLGELRPPRIDLLVVMAGFGGGQRHTACGHRPAQSGPHSGANGSASPIGVDDRLLEVDGVVDDAADLVGVGGLVGRAVGIGEQLGEVDLDVAGDRGQAARALPRRRRGHRSGDQHALRHRLDPQIQLQRRAFIDRDQVQPDARRAGHRLVQRSASTRAAGRAGRC